MAPARAGWRRHGHRLAAIMVTAVAGSGGPAGAVASTTGPNVPPLQSMVMTDPLPGFTAVPARIHQRAADGNGVRVPVGESAPGRGPVRRPGVPIGLRCLHPAVDGPGRCGRRGQRSGGPHLPHPRRLAGRRLHVRPPGALRRFARHAPLLGTQHRRCTRVLDSGHHSGGRHRAGRGVPLRTVRVDASAGLHDFGEQPQPPHQLAGRHRRLPAVRTAPLRRSCRLGTGCRHRGAVGPAASAPAAGTPASDSSSAPVALVLCGGPRTGVRRGGPCCSSAVAGGQERWVPDPERPVGSRRDLRRRSGPSTREPRDDQQDRSLPTPSAPTPARHQGPAQTVPALILAAEREVPCVPRTREQIPPQPGDQLAAHRPAQSSLRKRALITTMVGHVRSRPPGSGELHLGYQHVGTGVGGGRGDRRPSRHRPGAAGDP